MASGVCGQKKFLSKLARGALCQAEVDTERVWSGLCSSQDEKCIARVIWGVRHYMGFRGPRGATHESFFGGLRMGLKT